MIFYAEDDASIRELVIYTLKNTGFEAKGFEDGILLLNEVKKEKPELILLDIMLPEMDGVSVLKRLKQDAKTKDIPVIMLTAKNTEYDKVVGLDEGADDYLSKPFGMMELVSRIKAVLRRSVPPKGALSDELHAGRIVLNLQSHKVTVDGKKVELALKEFELLELLIRNAGRVLTRDMLLESIWGFSFDGETRTVDVHVRTLRAKLGDAGNIIETIRGVGYTIDR